MMHGIVFHWKPYKIIGKKEDSQFQLNDDKAAGGTEPEYEAKSALKIPLTLSGMNTEEFQQWIDQWQLQDFVTTWAHA